MSKLKTTEDNLLDILLSIVLIVIIALFFSAIKSCTTKKELDKKDLYELCEMIHYQSSTDCLILEENGLVIIKK